MQYFLQGFLLQSSLILALGAQNLFVMESGLKKQRHLLVAFLCSLCDAVLIALGVTGAASIFVLIPNLKIIVTFLGIAFLLYYGLKKLYEGMMKHRDNIQDVSVVIDSKKIIFLTLSFSLLNPHVYLDTVILIGGYSAKFPELIDRVKFGFGAASFSIIWFYGLSIFASYLSTFFKNPKVRKSLNYISGTILIGLAIKLTADLLLNCP